MQPVQVLTRAKADPNLPEPGGLVGRRWKLSIRSNWPETLFSKDVTESQINPHGFFLSCILRVFLGEIKS